MRSLKFFLFSITSSIHLLGATGENLLRSFDASIESTRDKLVFQSESGSLYAQMGVQVDFWLYHTSDGGPPGFFFPSPNRETDYSPRLTLFFDTFIGDNLFLFAKVRWDDGVHPGVGEYYNKPGQVRADEWYARYTVEKLNLNLQAGQFTPIYGNFLARQNTWDMGLISYPQLYEVVLSVSDIFPPDSPERFANRANLAANKLAWVPVVWAPLYNRGVSAFGSSGDFQYAISYMNSAPSSRGLDWNDNDWSAPTIMARFGWKPNAAWKFGINFSDGAYLRSDAQANLNPNQRYENYNQRNIHLDLHWAGRTWQVWAEVFRAEFEIPNLSDNAEIYSAYVETRWDFHSNFWLSTRLNWEDYNTITLSDGTEADWDNRLERLDLGIGWRPSRFWQIKAQYSYTEQDADFQIGRHFYVMEATLKF